MNKKTLWIIGGVAVLGFAAWYFFLRKKKKFTQAELLQQATAQQLTVTQLQQAGVKASYSNNEYVAMADKIQSSLEGCETNSTEKQVVEDLLSFVKNSVDWLQLQQAFSVRAIDNCGIWTGDTSYNLVSLLEDQLDGTEAGTKYIDKLKAGLSAKNIKF